MNRDERLQLVTEPPEELARLLAPSAPEYALMREDTRQFLVEPLRKAMAVLPEQERPLLRLHHFHGLTMDRLRLMYGGSRPGCSRSDALSEVAPVPQSAPGYRHQAAPRKSEAHQLQLSLRKSTHSQRRGLLQVPLGIAALQPSLKMR